MEQEQLPSLRERMLQQADEARQRSKATVEAAQTAALSDVEVAAAATARAIETLRDSSDQTESSLRRLWPGK